MTDLVIALREATLAVQITAGNMIMTGNYSPLLLDRLNRETAALHDTIALFRREMTARAVSMAEVPS